MNEKTKIGLITASSKAPKGGFLVSLVESKGQTKRSNEEVMLPVFRCPQCLDHMGLSEYSISSTGEVTPSVTCLSCKTVSNVVLDGWDSKYDKESGRPWLRKIST